MSDTTFPPDSPPADDLRAEIDALQAQLDQARRARRDDAIRAEADDLRALNPDDVIAWAAAESPDLLAAALDEPAAVRQLVLACKAARPHFFGSSAPGSPSNFGAQPPSGDRSAIDRALNGRKLFRL
jgi:hypothetical protein